MEYAQIVQPTLIRAAAVEKEEDVRQGFGYKSGGEPPAALIHLHLPAHQQQSLWPKGGCSSWQPWPYLLRVGLPFHVIYVSYSCVRDIHVKMIVLLKSVFGNSFPYKMRQ